jgi:hypothetical protein
MTCNRHAHSLVPDYVVRKPRFEVWRKSLEKRICGHEYPLVQHCGNW